MEKETKKYLIIGTTIVVTVGIGVFLWKKHQAQAQSSDSGSGTPTDQSNQDELSFLAASLESNAYASATGGASYSPHAVGAEVPQTLADEVLAIERALGFAPTTPVATAPSSSTPSGSGSAPSAPSPASPSVPTPAPAPAHNAPASELIKYNHGAPIFAMDGVPGEGVLVS